jgi:hypothetical protein
MLESTARQRLESALANTAEPILAADVVDDLLLASRVMDRYGTPPDAYRSWRPNTAYLLGDLIVVADRGTHDLQLGGNSYAVFEAQDNGTSGAVEPTWPEQGQSVVDGAGGTTITWLTTDTITYWTGEYNVNKAAAAGWLLKAGLLSGTYGLTIAGNQLQRNQAYDHAIKQYLMYQRKAGLSSVRQRRTPRLPGENSVLGPLPTDSRFDGFRGGTRYLDITDPDF